VQKIEPISVQMICAHKALLLNIPKFCTEQISQPPQSVNHNDRKQKKKTGPEIEVWIFFCGQVVWNIHRKNPLLLSSSECADSGIKTALTFGE